MSWTKMNKTIFFLLVTGKKNQKRITIVGFKTNIVTVDVVSVHVNSPHKYVYPTAGYIDVVAKAIRPYPAETYANYYLMRSYIKSLIL